MKLRIILSAAAVAAASLSSASVFAQAASAPLTVDQRQNNQNERIKGGKEHGELTKREAVRLRAEQRVVNRTEKRAESDGVVTPKEQQRLHRMQTQASKDIHRQNHDAQKPAAK